MNVLRPTILLAVVLQLGACSGLRALRDVGREPPLSPITNPVETRGYEPVSMPMPRDEQESYQGNSLWRTGAKQFFRDQRARKVGDILTVKIAIEDKATLDNSTTRSRTTSEEAGVDNLFGLETYLDDVLPEDVDNANLVGVESTSGSTGQGQIDRAETIELTVAAIVTQILPNGNLVIQGSQEVRVNYEVRQLLVSGIVRPEDITNMNTIDHTQIAEARISYGGRGQITKLQQPRYGQQVYEVLAPF